MMPTDPALVSVYASTRTATSWCTRCNWSQFRSDKRRRGYSSDRTSPGRWFAMVAARAGGRCSAETPVCQAVRAASSFAVG